MSQSELLRRAHQLPAGLLGIMELADRYQPTAAIVCDCDARPIGRALELLAEERGKPIPTRDMQGLHYRRISKRVPQAQLDKHLSGLFEDIRATAGAETPRILVIDDHSSAGTTQYNFQKSLKNAGLHADYRWATYTGRHNGYSAFPHVGPMALMPWRDRPDVIGIQYSADLQPISIDTQASSDFYAAIAEGAREAIRNYRNANTQHAA